MPERYFDRSVKRGDLIAKQCVRYQGKAQVDQEAFACTVARVPQELAVDLRARIGLQVDERLQKIYWNEDELARWVETQDTSAMLGSMHRLQLAPGDAVLVPAGVCALAGFWLLRRAG